MAKSRKGSKRTMKKGSRKGSKKSRKGSKRGSKKSKKCPKGTRKSYKRLANGKLSKTALCLPFSGKAAAKTYERAEGEQGSYAEDEFNLPALGFRIKRKSRRGSRKTRKTHRRRHSRKH
jgi:hypothetical protein